MRPSVPSRWRRPPCQRNFRWCSRSFWASACTAWREAARSSVARSASRTSAGSAVSVRTRPGRSPRGICASRISFLRNATDSARLLTVAAAASRRESGDPLDTAILVRADRSRSRPRPSASVSRRSRSPRTGSARPQSNATQTVRSWRAPRAPAEIVLSLVPSSPAERQRWIDQVSALAASGHKVIACAWQSLDGKWTGAEPASDFRLAGLFAFEDPVRDGVAAAVAACRAAGIHVVMVTGDHPATARAVAREIGLATRPRRSSPAASRCRP